MWFWFLQVCFVAVVVILSAPSIVYLSVLAFITARCRVAAKINTRSMES